MTATTTGAGSRHRKEPPDGPALQRAEVLLRRGHLHHDPEIPWERIVAMLTRVLDRHDPSTSDHGRLLVAALGVRPRTRHARRAGPCRSAEHAVRQLLAHGQAPTPKAVADLLQRQQRWEQARARKLVRLAPIATRDGPTAARLVVDHWRDHGRPPPPAQLGKALGWRSYDAWAVIHLLVDAGWLALHHGQLQPGPRARGSMPGHAFP